MTSQMETTEGLFVYGTLREGCGNDRWARPGWVTPEQAVAPGLDLHYVDPVHRMYPVMVRGQRDDSRVIGELWRGVEVDDVMEVVRMEIGAGYDLAMFSVLVDGERVRAWGFLWDRAPRGELIPHGDWLRADPWMNRLDTFGGDATMNEFADDHHERS